MPVPETRPGSWAIPGLESGECFDDLIHDSRRCGSLSRRPGLSIQTRREGGKSPQNEALTEAGYKRCRNIISLLHVRVTSGKLHSITPCSFHSRRDACTRTAHDPSPRWCPTCRPKPAPLFPVLPGGLVSSWSLTMPAALSVRGKAIRSSPEVLPPLP